MSLEAKYQYTHFIYPFVIDEKEYTKFLRSVITPNSSWDLVFDEYKTNEELYNFFLPYMRKFLFPTLFWNKEQVKHYKSSEYTQKIAMVSKMPCVTFKFNLSDIKTGNVSGKKYNAISFDISDIRLMCFQPGICFLDIKTEIDDESQSIDFDKVLDFNHLFRTLTPNVVKNENKNINIIGKNIEKIENISIFINSIISGFETDDLQKIYYDKMFTYSYVCVDSKYWSSNSDFEKLRNDFYRFQYVLDSKTNSKFNEDCERLFKNTYSRWDYSKFGFSRESGVVFASDIEEYNITKLPYDFEKKYMYMLILALYQRISLINFSQDLLKYDKIAIQKLKKKLTNFTHFTWFSQITNSENGMDMWKSWQNAFGLQELFDEVHKEYMEYYDSIAVSTQEKISITYIIISITSLLLSGLSITANVFFIDNMILNKVSLILVIIAILIFPIYVIGRWFKYKVNKTYRK